MKKLNNVLLFVLLLAALTASKPAEKVNFTTGTYGVYHNTSTILIELKINNDFTFHYLNNSNPEKPVNVKGNWKHTGNTILLENYRSPFPINNKWTIDRNFNCLKSRKGIEFTRLCLVNSEE